MPATTVEREEGFTPFGIAVFDAMQRSRDKRVGAIAKTLGEPVCVVEAILKHLLTLGYVTRTLPKRRKRARA